VRYAAELEAELDRDLEAIHAAWKASSNGERDSHLFDALWLCHNRRLPEWLFKVFNELLIARVPKGEWRDRRRWQMVLEGRDEGLTWEDAYAYASERLAGSDAQGTPRTMKWSYQKLQQRSTRQQAKGATRRRA
jgi:hypothetical protein